MVYRLQYIKQMVIYGGNSLLVAGRAVRVKVYCVIFRLRVQG